MSLLARFAVLSLLVVVLMGWVVGTVLGDDVRARTRADAVRGAALVVNVGIKPLLTPDDLARNFAPIDQSRLATLNQALGSTTDQGASRDGIARIKVWNRQHWVVYSDNPRLVGKWFPGDDGLAAALAGSTNSEISNLNAPEELEERDFGRLLSVYVPLRATGDHFTTDPDAPVVGAFEIYLPYRPIAAAIAADTQRLQVTLALGLLVLWVVLFRLVYGASRRLTRQAAENRHQARHDPLTDLPNRLLFRDRVDAAIGRGDPVAVFLVDLDRFKEINDTLGHPRGDEILVLVGARLRTRAPAFDTVARLGGDEFAILVTGLDDPDAVLAVGAEIGARLEAPFAVGGLDLDVRASVGVACAPEDGGDADLLLQRADIAMYAAKGAHSGCERYRPELDQHHADQFELAADVRRGLEADEFVAHYQPKVDLRTGRVVGVEGLVRWQHPEQGLLAPGRFMPIVENTELIGPLTFRVLDRALADRAEWAARGVDLVVAVNLSARSLTDLTLPRRVADTLAVHGTPADRLELELTESAVLDNPARARAVLDELVGMGVSIAIDDFGTGYASLAYLAELPVRALKIDQSFVFGLRGGGQDAAVVRGSIDLGRSLGLEVVAEGVEDAETLRALAALGCGVAQGYHLSRPIAATPLYAWVRSFDPVAAGLSVPAPVDPAPPVAPAGAEVAR